MSAHESMRADTMKAIVIRGTEARLESNRPFPRLKDDCVLIKTEAVALNPTDWKHVALGLGADGCLLGCDFSGVVRVVGPAVTKPWKAGDRVCGVAHGGNRFELEDGAFAEYIMVKGDIQLRIPDNMTFTQAATLGLGVATVGQGLYQYALKLPLPVESPKQTHEVTNILIYGGSTATGALGIQFARLSGCKVYTTCSPTNFEYVKTLGAAEAFDYNDDKSISRLQEFTKGSGLRLAWDTIGTPFSSEFCMQAMSKGPGCKYGCVSFPPVPISRNDVLPTGTLMYSAFGEPFVKKGIEFPAKPEDYEFTKQFMVITEELLAAGKLRPHIELVGKGGLGGVLDGLQRMKNGKVSGNKLVYVVADTE
ncbi:hypothetical protein LTR84_006521 [Exophiala bonariae]|uniref:Enoyl reductase (ER) domain-containing protein n=1 Tax=Exophiala bonariae TaxID=1690606 RepID=A0AAV9N0M0_9EURO|nr:hypothetical protein LTR84_006521 [Exophiala bonariae]